MAVLLPPDLACLNGQFLWQEESNPPMGVSIGRPRLVRIER